MQREMQREMEFPKLGETNIFRSFPKSRQEPIQQAFYKQIKIFSFYNKKTQDA